MSMTARRCPAVRCAALALLLPLAAAAPAVRADPLETQELRITDGPGVVEAGRAASSSIRPSESLPMSFHGAWRAAG